METILWVIVFEQVIGNILLVLILWKVGKA